MVQNGLQMKEKILSLVKANGPSLPVFIAQNTGLSILFASAFLSELISDRELKTSNMRVGSSPLYLVPGQEPMLENYSQYLKNKEKEAYLLLKERKFLKDKDLEPAIRVALREIKDFAIAFQRNDDIFWRYLTVPEAEFSINETLTLKKEVISHPEKEVIEEVAEVVEVVEVAEKEIAESVFEKEVIKSESKKRTKHEKSPSKKIKRPTHEKDNRNNFFNKVKEFLASKQIEILDITEIGISKIIFRVRKDEEYLIIAYNKKKITEQDVINSHKKSEELGLPYKIILLGEPMKRFGNLIEAVKNLKDIEKIE